MKRSVKYFVAVIILMILAIGSGCSSSASNSNSSNSSSSGSAANKGEVLDGYPIDIMPLYKEVKISDCSYQVRLDPNYIIGKDLYTVSYESEATIAEVAQYYKSLMTEVDEEYSTEDFVEGDIGSQHTFVSLHEEENGNTYVSISLGAKQEDYAEVNPYFNDYPQEFIEEIKPSELIEQVFDIQYSAYNDDVITRYVKKYTTELTTSEVVTFYSELYSTQDSFAVNEDEYSTTIFWKTDGYECQISISEGTKSAFRYVQTEIRKYT